jgi:hypothetical protein
MSEILAAIGLIVVSPVVWAIAAVTEDETGAPHKMAEGAADAVKPPRA